MKTFVADIIPKIWKYSQRLDNLTILTNQHWVQFNNDESIKTVWIFRTNNVLLISRNGIVEKGSWEFLDNNSLLIETKQTSLLLKNGFFDDCILALKLDSQNEFAFFINENKSNNELNSIEQIVSFLESRYLRINNSHVESYQSSKELKSENNDEVLNKNEILNRYNFNSHGFMVLNVFNAFSLVDKNCELNEIQYSDGKKAKIYKIKSNGQSFFMVEKMFFGDKYYIYSDFESCVQSFHYYLTKNIISDKNLLEIFQ